MKNKNINIHFAKKIELAFVCLRAEVRSEGDWMEMWGPAPSFAHSLTLRVGWASLHTPCPPFVFFFQIVFSRIQNCPSFFLILLTETGNSSMPEAKTKEKAMEHKMYCRRTTCSSCRILQKMAACIFAWWPFNFNLMWPSGSIPKKRVCVFQFLF